VARVHLVAKLDAQVDELRREVRQRVDVVRAGPCD
jgi:hypothetical protein